MIGTVDTAAGPEGLLGFTLKMDRKPYATKHLEAVLSDDATCGDERSKRRSNGRTEMERQRDEKMTPYHA